MNMKELGDLLRIEREKQGLSLDEVHDSTKISKSALRSLEAGTAEDLPHPVYTKGFIKNYAELLGLDGDELAGEFSRYLSHEGRSEEMEEAHEAVMAAETGEPGSGRGKLLSLLATVILLGVLGWLSYDYFIKPSAEVERPKQKRSEAVVNNTEPETNGSAAQESSKPEAAGSEAEKPAAEPQPARKAQSPEATQPKPAKRAQGPVSDQPPTEPEAAENRATAQVNASVNQTAELKPETITYDPDSGTEQEEQTERPDQTAGTHTLRIEATEDCWFEAQVDGASKDVYLRPGESVSLTFENDLLVKLGNAGGVSLSYDGEPYPLEASSGEVKTLTFP